MTSMLDQLKLFINKKSLPLWMLGIAAGLISGFAGSALVAFATSLVARRQVPDVRTIWLLVGLSVLAPCTFFVSQVLIVHITQKITGGMLLKLSHSILAAPLLELEKIGRDRIIAVITEDVYSVARGFFAAPDIFLHSAILIGCFVYLAWMSIVAFLWVLAFLVIVVFAYAKAHAKAMDFMRLSMLQRDILRRHIGALTTGTKELKLNYRRRHEFLDRHFYSAVQRYFKHNLSAIAIYTAVSSGYEFMFWLAVGLIAFVLFPWLKLPQTTAVSFALVLIYMLREAAMLAHTAPALAQVHVRIESIQRLGLKLSEHASAEGVPSPIPSWKNIELHDVVLNYGNQDDSSSFRLGPISLNLYPGEIVFVVGGNGCGKTTLAKVISGLYIPTEGEILLDGTKIDDNNRVSYSELFSAIFADFYLFDSLLGFDGPNRDRDAERYVAKLRLESKVKFDDGRFSTLDLSQGQRKRLALLVTYLENRPVCILDEWAADQDSVFREYFYRELLPAMKQAGKCVIVISHDDRYYNIADRVVSLEYGLKRHETLKTLPEANHLEAAAVSSKLSPEYVMEQRSHS